MAMRSLIPDALVVPLLKQYDLGLTAEKLSVWLKENHGIAVSIAVINSRIKSYKDIELQAKKEAISRRASEQALDYVQMMDQKILKLNEITNDLLNTKDAAQLSLAKSLLETQLKYIDKQMNLTGMDKEDPELDEEVIIEGLIGKLGK